MQTSKNDTFPEALRSIRAWEDRQLPMSQSRIAFDLFLLLFEAFRRPREMSLKVVVNSLNYSERGIRYVLDQFIDDRWCELKRHQLDGRTRLIVPTEKLVAVAHEYERFVMTRYTELLSASSGVDFLTREFDRSSNNRDVAPQFTPGSGGADAAA